jgi:FkbM family methyltransferase
VGNRILPRKEDALTLTDRLGLLRSRIIYDLNPVKASRMRRFYRDFVAPGSLCFDIGAHVGDRTAMFRKLGAKVVSLEPQRSCMRILERRFAEDQEVVLIAAAAGRREGSAQIRLSPGNPTLATLSPEWIDEVRKASTFQDIAWTEGETVPVTTLDGLIERFGTPSFVKIDVEGYEAEVLSGLSVPVDSLSFEYLPAALSTAFEALDLVSRLGDYRFNLSIGERFRMEYPQWVDADEIRKWFRGLRSEERSGDVYATRTGGAVLR